MFGVAAIAVEAAGESASADEELAGVGVVAVRLFARERFARDFAEESFTNAHTWNRERPQIQITAERDEDQSGDAHNVGAVAANAVGFHAGVDVAAEQIREALAEK